MAKKEIKIKLSTQGTKKAQKEIRGVDRSIRTLATTMVGFVGFAVMTKGLNTMITAASDTEESLNKVREVFGLAAKSVEKFSSTAATSLGASTQEALAMTGEIGNLLVAFGFAEDKAAGFSNKMVQLAADLGSFNNVPTKEALNAIRAGLVGETEPMRRFGSDLRQVRLDAIALGMGLEFTKGAMDSQTKAIAAMEAIMQDTGKAQGDFKRTSDGLANSQKILKANFEDMQSVLGKKLMPIMSGAVSLLNSFITTFTESNFDRAIKRLIDLGAEVSFVEQLKVQNQINESLKDRTRLAKEINDFELMTGQITLDQIAQNKELNRLVGTEHITKLQESLALQLEAAKKTGDTAKAQETINELQRVSFGINEKNVAIANGIAIATGNQKRALEATENIIVRTIDQATNFLINLKEQEKIEQRILDLKSGRLNNQTSLNIATQQEFEIIKASFDFRIDAIQQELVLLEARKLIGNDFINQTQTQIVMSSSLARNAFEIANGFGQAVIHIRNLGEALTGVLKQLASRGLAGLIAGGIASFIPGGGFLETFRKISGFQSGGRPPVGEPVIVGERGPEKVVFDRPATVIPNAGGNTLNVHLHGVFHGSVDELAEEIANRSDQNFNRIKVNA